MSDNNIGCGGSPEVQLTADQVAFFEAQKKYEELCSTALNVVENETGIKSEGTDEYGNVQSNISIETPRIPNSHRDTDWKKSLDQLNAIIKNPENAVCRISYFWCQNTSASDTYNELIPSSQRNIVTTFRNVNGVTVDNDHIRSTQHPGSSECRIVSEESI